jgi:hypothetical protein
LETPAARAAAALAANPEAILTEIQKTAKVGMGTAVRARQKAAAESRAPEYEPPLFPEAKPPALVDMPDELVSDIASLLREWTRVIDRMLDIQLRCREIATRPEAAPAKAMLEKISAGAPAQHLVAEKRAIAEAENIQAQRRWAAKQASEKTLH